METNHEVARNKRENCEYATRNCRTVRASTRHRRIPRRRHVYGYYTPQYHSSRYCRRTRRDELHAHYGESSRCTKQHNHKERHELSLHIILNIRQ